MSGRQLLSNSDTLSDVDLHDEKIVTQASRLPRFYDQEKKAKNHILVNLSSDSASAFNLPSRVLRYGLSSSFIGTSKMFINGTKAALIAAVPWVISGGCFAIEAVGACCRLYKHRSWKIFIFELGESLLLHGTLIPCATVGAILGSFLFPGIGTIIGGIIGSVLAYPLAKQIIKSMKSKPENEWPGFNTNSEKEMYMISLKFFDIYTEFPTRGEIEYKKTVCVITCHPVLFVECDPETRREKSTRFMNLLYCYEMIKMYHKSHRNWDEEWKAEGNFRPFGADRVEVVVHYKERISLLLNELKSLTYEKFEDKTEEGTNDVNVIVKRKAKFIRRLHRIAESLKRQKEEREKREQDLKLLNNKIQLLMVHVEYFTTETFLEIVPETKEHKKVVQAKIELLQGLGQYVTILARQEETKEEMERKQNPSFSSDQDFERDHSISTSIVVNNPVSGRLSVEDSDDPAITSSRERENE